MDAVHTAKESQSRKEKDSLCEVQEKDSPGGPSRGCFEVAVGWRILRSWKLKKGLFWDCRKSIAWWALFQASSLQNCNRVQHCLMLSSWGTESGQPSVSFRKTNAKVKRKYVRIWESEYFHSERTAGKLRIELGRKKRAKVRSRAELNVETTPRQDHWGSGQVTPRLQPKASMNSERDIWNLIKIFEISLH